MPKYEFKKMRPALKKRWVAALRSKLYPQGVGQLQGSGGFCCLGVLCEILPEAKWDSEAEGYNIKGHIFKADVPARIVDMDAQSEVVKMNDEKGKSFAAIATWVEKHL